MLKKLPMVVFKNQLFTGLLWLVCILLLLLSSYRSLVFPLEYDEAYNLQVVDMLAKGYGYASYGALGGKRPCLFDAFISTGPVVLIPLAFVWKITTGSLLAIRLSMLAFLWVYVIGLFVLFQQKESYGIISAIAVASSLCIEDMTLGRVMGELPAAMMIIFAVWSFSHNKIYKGCLAIGLVIQTKLVYGLAGLAILLVFYLPRLLLKKPFKRINTVIAGCSLLAPTLLFEIFRFWSLSNLELYYQSIDTWWLFLQEQKIHAPHSWLDQDIWLAKLTGLCGMFSTWGWFACAFAILLNGVKPKRIFSHATGSMALIWAGMAILFSWITLSNQLNPRQVLPFFLLSMPALFARATTCYLGWCQTKPANTRSWVLHLLFACCLLFIVIALAVKAPRMIDNASNHHAFAEQKYVVELIQKANPDSLYVDGWWQNPEYQLLSGVFATRQKTGRSQLMIVQDYQVHILKKTFDFYQNKCGQVIYASPKVLLCWLPKV